MAEYTWKSVPLTAMNIDQLRVAASEMADLIFVLADGMAVQPVQNVTRHPTAGKAADPRAIARMRGYAGDACPECMNFTLVRNGTCLRCDTCGATTGCS